MTDRAHQYAAITLALQRHPGQYGAEALFNQALTVALLEIANPTPGKNGRLPPARKLLATLDDDEISRRVDTLPDHRTPGGVDEPEPQDCPVCGNTTLLAVGCDPYGYGIGAGHCHVCSYYRSPEAAELEAWTWEMRRLAAKPDPHDDPQQPDVT